MKKNNTKDNRTYLDRKTSHSSPRSIVLIPCYNEEATVGSVVLQAKRYVDTVVVVDDGSSDNTVEIAKDAGAIVLSHHKNRGKGAALKTGFQYAHEHNFDYIVTIDGDGQHNPIEIPMVLGNVMNNGHDISIGYRFGISTEMPTWRRVGKRVLDYTTSMGTGGFVTDSQCGFRAFNKRAVALIAPKLRGNAFSIESEQLIIAHEVGLKVINTNVTCKYQNLKTSTKNPASHGLSVLVYVLWVVAKQRLLLYFGILGFISIVIGLVLKI